MKLSLIRTAAPLPDDQAMIEGARDLWQHWFVFHERLATA